MSTRANLVARRLETGQQLCHRTPEARTVIELLEVRKFMRDDVVDHRQREVDQSPAESDTPVVRTRSPL